MSETLINGQRFRTFNVIDDFNRAVLKIEIDTSRPSTRVMKVLDQITSWPGCPEKLRVDNGINISKISCLGRREAGQTEFDVSQEKQPRTHVQKD
ncbi:hypothetical protein CMK12_01850 [Candidatus Poribacteria bacterium]|jgi:putative transposase|nr:hypothetical protein [Candidatus Poribacteria bacterium]MDP6595856.1 hypothetical protein [Candidatus Poribacteria bacterium]MDP6745784.1 hypothetical protein [Candidatus Poribacteria bacterium]MDP6995108.1 hypothetical protein [Candidatus Poribacteria bacterium]